MYSPDVHETFIHGTCLEVISRSSTSYVTVQQMQFSWKSICLHCSTKYGRRFISLCFVYRRAISFHCFRTINSEVLTAGQFWCRHDYVWNIILTSESVHHAVLLTSDSKNPWKAESRTPRIFVELQKCKELELGILIAKRAESLGAKLQPGWIMSFSNF